MQAQQMLKSMTTAGMALSLSLNNNLKVTPAKSLNGELRSTLSMYKPALVNCLQRQVGNGGEPPPDRCCWPTSFAMNGEKIDLFNRRGDRLGAQGKP